MKPPKVRPRRQRFLTADQVEVLAAACEDRQPGAGAVVMLLAWSGLRWGDAVAPLGLDRHRAAAGPG